MCDQEAVHDVAVHRCILHPTGACDLQEVTKQPEWPTFRCPGAPRVLPLVLQHCQLLRVGSGHQRYHPFHEEGVRAIGKRKGGVLRVDTWQKAQVAAPIPRVPDPDNPLPMTGSSSKPVLVVVAVTPNLHTKARMEV